jgi:hypothetical protein
MEVEVNNEKPGAIFSGINGINLSFEIKPLTFFQDAAIQILRNGKTVKEIRNPQKSESIIFNIMEEDSCWYAVRFQAKSESPFALEEKLCAHSSPFYVESSTPVLESECRKRLIQWCRLFFSLRYPRPAKLEPGFNIDKNPDPQKIFPYIKRAFDVLKIKKDELFNAKFKFSPKENCKPDLKEALPLENTLFDSLKDIVSFSRGAENRFKYSGVFWNLKLPSGIYKIESRVEKSQTSRQASTPWGGDGLKITVLDNEGKCLAQSADKNGRDGKRSCILKLNHECELIIIYTAERQGDFAITAPRIFKVEFDLET